MSFAIRDFMANWLNTTYAYLQQTGGPTYPPATVGPDVVPTGPYCLKEDGSLEECAPTIYKDTAPISFNPYNMGLPALKPNQNQNIIETVRQNPAPKVISSMFTKLFGDNMKACIDDQRHRACNSNPELACKNLADSSDLSGFSLAGWHMDALGMAPIAQSKDKPDEIQKAENNETLTSQISQGARDTWAGFANISSYIKKAPGYPAPTGPTGDPGNPEGSNFQAIGNSVKSFIDPFIPKAPGMPSLDGINSATIIMVGGGALLLILVIAVIK